MIHVLTIMQMLREEERRSAGRTRHADGNTVSLPEKALQILAGPEKRLRRSFSAGEEGAPPMLVDAFVTCHSTARGPALCPIYLHPEVTQDDVDRIAEKMAWKAALMGLPLGGGCIGLRPHSYEPLNSLAAYAARELATVYRTLLTSGAVVAMPGCGVRANEMGVLSDELLRRDIAVGKPWHLGGLRGFHASRGRGVFAATEAAVRARFDCGLAGRTCALYGTGAVGRWTARFLNRAGARLVAVADGVNGRFNASGVSVAPLLRGSPRGMPPAANGDCSLAPADIVSLGVDALVITEAQDLFPADRIGQCRARVIVAGADDAVSNTAHERLTERGIIVVPEILAASGDLVAAFLELCSTRTRIPVTRSCALMAVDACVAAAFEQAQRATRKRRQSLGVAARTVATENLVAAMYESGWL